MKDELKEHYDRFNYDSIDKLLGMGGDMKYDADLGHLGLYMPERRLVLIGTFQPRQIESETILHEWLHMYDHLILPPSVRLNEKIVEKWCKRKHRDELRLADYIRSYFHSEGFD